MVVTVKACSPQIILTSELVCVGMQPVVVENLLIEDELKTDVAAVEARITELGAENIVCVLTTTSCFAPRVPDR